MIPAKVDLKRCFQTITTPWEPKILADINDCQIKVAKFSGEFDWHHHEEEDEAFLVIRGEIRIDFDETAVVLLEGELLVVPRGARHRPVCITETADVLLFEPAATRNTGNVTNGRTIESLDRVRPEQID